MHRRIFCGIVGLVLTTFAFPWSGFMPELADRLDSALSAAMTISAMFSGIYLLFFGLTGDWLPDLSRRRDQS